MIAEAQVQTEHASRYLAELCRQFEQRAEAKPELGVHVEWTDTDGTVDFGWGRCTLRADESMLALRVEASDHDGLRQVQELLSRHLEGHGEPEPLAVTWLQDGPPAADSHADRRDTMRAFHRRMRH